MSASSASSENLLTNGTGSEDSSEPVSQTGICDSTCSDASYDLTVSAQNFREGSCVRFNPDVSQHCSSNDHYHKHSKCDKCYGSKGFKSSLKNKSRSPTLCKPPDVEISRPLCCQVLDNARVATPSVSRQGSTRSYEGNRDYPPIQPGECQHTTTRHRPEKCCHAQNPPTNDCHGCPNRVALPVSSDQYPHYDIPQQAFQQEDCSFNNQSPVNGFCCPKAVSATTSTHCCPPGQSPMNNYCPPLGASNTYPSDTVNCSSLPNQPPLNGSYSHTSVSGIFSDGAHCSPLPSQPPMNGYLQPVAALGPPPDAANCSSLPSQPCVSGYRPVPASDTPDAAYCSQSPSEPPMNGYCQPLATSDTSDAANRDSSPNQPPVSGYLPVPASDTPSDATYCNHSQSQHLVNCSFLPTAASDTNPDANNCSSSVSPQPINGYCHPVASSDTPSSSYFNPSPNQPPMNGFCQPLVASDTANSNSSPNQPPPNGYCRHITASDTTSNADNCNSSERGPPMNGYCRPIVTSCPNHRPLGNDPSHGPITAQQTAEENFSCHSTQLNNSLEASLTLEGSSLRGGEVHGTTAPQTGPSFKNILPTGQEGGPAPCASSRDLSLGNSQQTTQDNTATTTILSLNDKCVAPQTGQKDGSLQSHDLDLKGNIEPSSGNEKPCECRSEEDSRDSRKHKNAFPRGDPCSKQEQDTRVCPQTKREKSLTSANTSSKPTSCDAQNPSSSETDSLSNSTSNIAEEHNSIVGLSGPNAHPCKDSHKEGLTPEQSSSSFTQKSPSTSSMTDTDRDAPAQVEVPSRTRFSDQHSYYSSARRQFQTSLPVTQESTTPPDDPPSCRTGQASRNQLASPPRGAGSKRGSTKEQSSARILDVSCFTPRGLMLLGIQPKPETSLCTDMLLPSNQAGRTSSYCHQDTNSMPFPSHSNHVCSHPHTTSSGVLQPSAQTKQDMIYPDPSSSKRHPRGTPWGHPQQLSPKFFDIPAQSGPNHTSLADTLSCGINDHAASVPGSLHNMYPSAHSIHCPSHGSSDVLSEDSPPKNAVKECACKMSSHSPYMMQEPTSETMHCCPPQTHSPYCVIHGAQNPMHLAACSQCCLSQHDLTSCASHQSFCALNDLSNYASHHCASAHSNLCSCGSHHDNIVQPNISSCTIHSQPEAYLRNDSNEYPQQDFMSLHQQCPCSTGMAKNPSNSHSPSQKAFGVHNFDCFYCVQGCGRALSPSQQGTCKCKESHHSLDNLGSGLPAMARSPSNCSPTPEQCSFKVKIPLSDAQNCNCSSAFQSITPKHLCSKEVPMALGASVPMTSNEIERFICSRPLFAASKPSEGVDITKDARVGRINANQTSKMLLRNYGQESLPCSKHNQYPLFTARSAQDGSNRFIVEQSSSLSQRARSLRFPPNCPTDLTGFHKRPNTPSPCHSPANSSLYMPTARSPLSSRMCSVRTLSRGQSITSLCQRSVPAPIINSCTGARIIYEPQPPLSVKKTNYPRSRTLDRSKGYVPTRGRSVGGAPSRKHVNEVPPEDSDPNPTLRLMLRDNRDLVSLTQPSDNLEDLVELKKCRGAFLLDFSNRHQRCLEKSSITPDGSLLEKDKVRVISSTLPSAHSHDRKSKTEPAETSKHDISCKISSTSRHCPDKNGKTPVPKGLYLEPASESSSLPNITQQKSEDKLKLVTHEISDHCCPNHTKRNK